MAFIPPDEDDPEYGRNPFGLDRGRMGGMAPGRLRGSRSDLGMSTSYMSPEWQREILSGPPPGYELATEQLNRYSDLSVGPPGYQYREYPHLDPWPDDPADGAFADPFAGPRGRAAPDPTYHNLPGPRNIHPALRAEASRAIDFANPGMVAMGGMPLDEADMAGLDGPEAGIVADPRRGRFSGRFPRIGGVPGGDPEGRARRRRSFEELWRALSPRRYLERRTARREARTVEENWMIRQQELMRAQGIIREDSPSRSAGRGRRGPRFLYG